MQHEHEHEHQHVFVCVYLITYLPSRVSSRLEPLPNIEYHIQARSGILLLVLV